MSALQTVTDFFSNMAKKAGILKDNQPELNVSNMDQSKHPVEPVEPIEIDEKVERPKRQAVNVIYLYCLIYY